MKTLILGAGSLGSLLGAHLAQRFDVHLVGRDPHMAQVARTGLRISGALDVRVHPRATTIPPPHWVPDVTIVACKAYDTARIASSVAQAAGPRTLTVTVQNGLGNLEELGQALAGKPVVAASVVYGARLLEPGHVQATGTPGIHIGHGPDDFPVAEALAEAWSLVGLHATAVSDIRGVLLGKALVNAVINPLTALAGVPNGMLLRDEDLRAQLHRLSREAQQLAEAAPFRIPFADVEAEVCRVAEATAENRSSMLQDFERGRPTEAAAITGRLLEHAQAWGVSMPEHEAVWMRLRASSSMPAPTR